jgi:predicted transcriptional regulator
MKTVIRTGNVEDLFKRGREVARLADQGKRIPAERIIAYEDPEELARILTTAKIALFRAIKEQSGSITDIATRLKRDRSAVKRDIDDLEQAGLVSVEEKLHPGHGRLKEVRVAADRVVLEAVFA